MRELKDYLIHQLLQLRENKESYQFDLIVKLAKLFKDENLAFYYIEWWIQSPEKNVYITEPSNKVIHLDEPENLVDYLIYSLGIKL